jgi:hypothetical protein
MCVCRAETSYIHYRNLVIMVDLCVEYQGVCVKVAVDRKTEEK